MPDRTFTKLKREAIPAKALWWPGKILLIIKGNQLGVTYIIILNEDGTPHEWPISLTGKIHETVTKYG